MNMVHEMGLKGILWRKYKEWEKKKDEEKLLKKIYKTRKEYLLKQERRKATHDIAEKHAREQARKEIKETFRPISTQKEIIQKYAKNLLNLPDITGISHQNRINLNKKKIRKVDFGRYL